MFMPRVHAIFQLPANFPLAIDEPLAYVEWFTPLRLPDATTGFHHISKSTRRKNGIDGPYAEIIHINRIVRSAMLFPISGGSTSHTLLNMYIDQHTFCVFKLGLSNCFPT